LAFTFALALGVQVTGPGVPKGRIDHSLISAVDYFPTIAALSGNPIPTGTVLRGGDISDIWHGKVNHKTLRDKPIFQRGGGGPPPCWNRSPGLAVRNGDWKLLFSPNNGERARPLSTLNPRTRNGANTKETKGSQRSRSECQTVRLFEDQYLGPATER
jgi:arylsulfatase A-like enzyme